MNKVLLLDNYDSFTFNLAQLLEILQVKFEVIRNDKISVAEVDAYDKILLSPGPGLPSEAGIMPQLVKQYASTKSILGVCLGHQCIAEIFGAHLINMPVPMHGKSSAITVSDAVDPIFSGLPEKFTAGRYHSWLVDKKNLPDELKVTAFDEAGNIMALRHMKHRVFGVQFHPESVMTDHGEKMIANWLKVV